MSRMVSEEEKREAAEWTTENWREREGNREGKTKNKTEEKVY